MDRSAEVLAFLRELDIPYKLYEHAPMETIGQCQTIQGVNWDEAAMCKNVFLCNRQETQYFLVLLRHDRSFRTAVVSKLLGVSRLSFARQAVLPELLGLDAGAVSPLGLMFDRGRRVRLAMDNALMGYQRLLFHPGVNHLSVEIAREDFMQRFLPKVAHPVELISLEEQENG